MSRLPRIDIDVPVGYDSSDFVSIVKSKMPKDSMVVENGMIVMRMYTLGTFVKKGKTFSAWGMRLGNDISIFVEEVKPV